MENIKYFYKNQQARNWVIHFIFKYFIYLFELYTNKRSQDIWKSKS